MERFVTGDIILLNFPFTNLKKFKKRPALIIANPSPSTFIVCQITSVMKKDGLFLTDDDLRNGRLNLTSIIRPHILFTIESLIILRKIGTVKKEKLQEVKKKIADIFNI